MKTDKTLRKFLFNQMIKVLPGGLRGNAELVGLKETLKLIFGTAINYRRTILWYIGQRKLRALRNFFYVKALVPVGEGAGAGLYFLIGPLIRRFPDLAPYPKYVEIEITTVCNKRCVLCEHTYWEDQEERHLTFDEFRQIVNQFPKLKWVNLTGEGDAFLNPDYLKMIKCLKSKDVPVFLVDSFDLINKKIARELVEMGVDGIYVSMDGATKETYDRIKVGCNFDRSLTNIRNLIELKKELKTPIPELCFRFVITTINLHEIPEFPEVVSSIGNRKELGDGSRIEYCGLLGFDPISHYQVSRIPDNLIKTTITKAKGVGIPVFFAHSDLEKSPPLEHCLAWLEPYIMMGGYVLPCCAVLMSNNRTFLRKNAFGILFESSFKEIWKSERYRRFRNTINNPKAQVPLFCLNCRAYDTRDRATKYGIDNTL